MIIALCLKLIFLSCQAIAEMLPQNTTLESLNIESNFITAEGMMAIIKAMSANNTLAEIKIDNQVTSIKQLLSHVQKKYLVVIFQGFNCGSCCINAEAETGRFSGDGNCLYVGKQFKHPEDWLSLHPAGPSCPSSHGHHQKQWLLWVQNHIKCPIRFTTERHNSAHSRAWLTAVIITPVIHWVKNK